MRDDGPSMDGLSDDQLLAAIGRGERPAFRLLMERHGRPMLALARRIAGNADDADEIVQDAFLKVWTTAGRWRAGGRATFSTWLYRVVLNACLDRRRRAPFVPLEDAGDPADPGPGGFEQAALRQRRRLVVDALAGLPRRQAEVLTLYYFGEVSGPQAAQILDLSVSAVEALLVRGRRSLKKLLAAQGVRGMGDVA